MFLETETLGWEPNAQARETMSSYQEGMDAYERGDYDTALKEWRPLAERGNEAAQANLGAMYYLGHGVGQNYQEAAQWFQSAARQGNAKAQFNLGGMYSEGKGFPRTMCWPICGSPVQPSRVLPRPSPCEKR